MPAVAIKDSINDSGTVAYNGFGFPALRQVKLEQQMQYDGADRALAYSVYKLEVYFWAWGSTESALAADMETIRDRLSQPGGRLTITGLGYGDIDIDGVNEQDLRWGPHPKLLRLGQLGGYQALEGWWTCEFALNDCFEGSAGGRGLFVALNYDVVFAADERGLSTRVLTGYLQIANSKRAVGDRAVAVTADDVYFRAIAPVPPGFKRTQQQRKLDASRLREDFTLVDTELDTDDALPPGIAAGQLTFAIENGEEMNFQQWEFSISAVMDRLRGMDRSWAYKKWFEILDGTVANMRAQLSPSENDCIIPLRIRIENEKWGLETRFFASFRIFRSIQTILQLSQIWEPVPNSNYQLWASSMAAAWTGGISSPRFQASSDAIVDLCHQRLGGLTLSTTQATPGSDIPTSYISCDDVTESSSWLTYDNRLESETDYRTSYHQPAEAYTPSMLQDKNISTLDGDPAIAQLTRAKTSTVQYHGTPGMKVCMKGKAVRLKFKPLPPDLAQVGGYQVKLIRQKVDGPRLLGYNGPCPLYGLTWERCYLITDTPATTPRQSRKQSGPRESIVGGDI